MVFGWLAFAGVAIGAGEKPLVDLQCSGPTCNSSFVEHEEDNAVLLQSVRGSAAPLVLVPQLLSPLVPQILCRVYKGRNSFGAVVSSNANSESSHTAPLSLTKVVDMKIWGQGNCSYPGMMVPDPSKALEAFSSFETVFQSAYGSGISDSFVSLLGVQLQAASAQGPPSPITLWRIAENTVTGLLPPTPDGITPIQGAGGKWQQDSFTSTWIGKTMTASFLEPVGDEWVLDFTGAKTSNPSMLHSLVQRAANAATPAMLRCKAYFKKNKAHEPKLLRIDVVDSTTGTTETFSAGSSTRWGLAKLVVSSMVSFVSGQFHTALHLLSAQITAAYQLSVPQGTALHAYVNPSATGVMKTIFDQMESLHNDHGAAWSGLIWDSNITEVRAIAADIARFLLQAEVHEIMGCSAPSGKGSNPECPAWWWAGGAYEFMEPIHTFTHDVAREVGNEKRLWKGFAKELKVNGMLMECDSKFWKKHLAKPIDLSRFLAKITFVQAIYHTSMFMQRELVIEPGLPETSNFFPLLQSAVTDALSLTEAILKAHPYATPKMVSSSVLNFAVSNGLPGAPELGDGPWFGVPRSIQKAVGRFQADLKATRQSVESMFSKGAGIQYIPSYYYPADAPKPTGYQITATVYL